MYTMSSSRTALYIILRSPYANRHSVVAIGTFISIRYTPSVCSTSTLPKFDKKERKQYEDSVNAYRDIVNAIRTAEKKKFAKGRAKGKAEGIAEGMAKGGKTAKVKIAANLLSLGVPMKTIIQASGLSEEEIKNMIQ